MKVIWQHPGIKAEAVYDGIHGTARLFIKDEKVFESHGGIWNIPSEWTNERQAIIDLAVILSFEIYRRDLKEFHEFICMGFKNGEIVKEPISCESKPLPPVSFEDGQGLLF
jgi:hypothetical protein